MDFQRLSETEMKVMQIIWGFGCPITSAELLRYFAQRRGKVWKAQTVSTFLTRLVEKGVLLCERKGRVNTYAPRISPEEYRRMEAQSVLDRMYKGSVKNFLAALYDGKKLKKDELAELKKWFSER